MSTRLSDASPPPAPRPDVMDELLAEAAEALADGQPDRTLELVVSIRRDHPGHLGALYLEAEARRDLRDGDGAEQRYAELLAHVPDHADAWAGLGMVRFHAGRFDEALACFSRAIRLAPATAEALHGRSLVRERRGDHRGARRDQARAWALSSRFPAPGDLDTAEIRALLSEASEHLSPVSAAWAEALPVVLLDLPDLPTCAAYDPPASPAELLVHLAAPLEDPEVGPRPSVPPSLLVFRRNVNRFSDDRAALLEAITDALASQLELWHDQATAEA
jgi:tetratricopeptide (TPR) repeat protein